MRTIGWRSASGFRRGRPSNDHLDRRSHHAESDPKLLDGLSRLGGRIRRHVRALKSCDVGWPQGHVDRDTYFLARTTQRSRKIALGCRGHISAGRRIAAAQAPAFRVHLRIRGFG